MNAKVDTSLCKAKSALFTLDFSSLPLIWPGKSTFCQFVLEFGPHLISVLSGKVPVNRLVQTIHELDIRFPIQKRLSEFVIRHPVVGAGGHIRPGFNARLMLRIS